MAYLDVGEGLLDKLERLQNQCIRFVFGLRKFDHVSEFRSQLNWLPVRIRRKIHILSLLFKVLFNPSSPKYLQEKFTFREIDSRLRASGTPFLMIPPSSSQTFAKSFSVLAAKLWNALPSDIKMASSLFSFKTKLKDYYKDSLSS